MNLIFLRRLKIGIRMKNSATETIVEPRYAIPAVAHKFKPKRPVPIGIAPLSSISGNIDTNSVAAILFPPKRLSKKLPKASVMILLPETLAFYFNL